MPKTPDAATELAGKMTQALETLRAQGADYPPTLGRLRELADAEAPSELAFKALGKKPLKDRAAPTNKKSLAAPIALREDVEHLVASPATLEFVLHLLGEKGKAPWPVKNLSAKLEKPLREPFEAAVNRQVADNTLPDSVAAVEVKGQPALHLKTQELPPPKPKKEPKPPKPEVELAQRLVQVLEVERQLGPESYPVRLPRLIERTGLPATDELLAKALNQKAFKSKAVLLLNKAKGQKFHPASPVIFAEDLEQIAQHPVLAAYLLELSRTDAVQAFTVSELKAKLVKPAQQLFADSLARRLEEGTLPAGLGWLGYKNERLLFRLEDVRGSAPVSEVTVITEAPPVVIAEVELPPASDFEAAFTEAFDQLDQVGGSNNFVSLVHLRQALPLFDRATFDAELRRLREAGRFVLNPAEGRYGLSEEEIAAGITEDGVFRLFVSRS